MVNDRSKLMTNKNEVVCPEKLSSWPDIVHCPAVILSPEALFFY